MRTETTPSKSLGKSDYDIEQRLTKLENILNRDVIDKLQVLEEKLQQMSTSQSKVQNTTIQSTDSLISQLQQEQSTLIQKVSQLEAFIGEMMKASPNTSYSQQNGNLRSQKHTNQQLRMSQPSCCQERMTQRMTEISGEKRNNSAKAQIRNNSNDQKQAEFAQELQSLRYQIQDCLTLTQILHQNDKMNSNIGDSLPQSKSFGPDINPRQSLGNLLMASSKQDHIFQTQRGQLKKVASNSSIHVKPISSSAQPTKSSVLTSGNFKTRESYIYNTKTDITPVTQLKHSFVQSSSQRLPQKQIFKEQNILSEVSPIAKLRNDHISGFSFTNDITMGVNIHESVPLEKIIDGLDSQENQEEFSIKR